MGASPNNTSTYVSRFASLAKTTKFAWVFGHFVVVISAAFYWLSLRSTSLTSVWYRLLFVGAVESFGVLVYQSYSRVFAAKSSPASPTPTPTPTPTIRQALQDENLLYLFIAATWLVLSPQVALATVPFFIISLFHAVTYIVTDFATNVLLIQDLKTHPYLKFLDSLVKEKHEASLNAICNSELICLLWNFLRLVTFRSRSFIAFALYFLFIRLKCYNSPHMKRSIAKWEVRLDGLIAHPSVPSLLKTQYTNLKLLLRRSLTFTSEKKSG